jgi:hypothetical protein
MAFSTNAGKMGNANDFSELAANHKSNPHTGEVNSYFFGKDQIMAMLESGDISGIRVHLGHDGQNMQVALGAADSEGNNGAMMMMGGVPCPGMGCPPE